MPIVVKTYIDQDQSRNKAQIATVGRFTETGRYLLITVYKVTEI